MKTKNRFALTVILAGIFSVATVAAQPGYGKGHGKMYGSGQGPGHGHGFGPDSCHIQLMVDDIAGEIGLSEKQEADILQLYYDHMAEMKTIPSEYKNDCVGEREARIQSRDKMEKAIHELLTEEQIEKFDAFFMDRHESHGPHHKGHHGKNK